MDWLGPRLALGTVQFGMPYGATHTGGIVTSNEAKDILDLARLAGIDTLDTAAAYGIAEVVLGTLRASESFRIVTKTVSLAGAATPAALEMVKLRFEQSLGQLATSSVDGLLVHDFRDLLGSGADGLWRQLELWKQSGQARRIGFSAYEAEDIRLVCERYQPDLVQLPLNVLDQRLVRDGTLEWLRDRGVAVHVRSVFLQGLLLVESTVLPARNSNLAAAHHRWRNALKESSASPIAAALGFVSTQTGVEKMVIGVQSRSELSDILDATRGPCPTLDWPTLACDDPVLVDPRRWSKP